ncbi:hypothetical protein SLEP1_g54864 [Rubroshorea leprosula]|uniref:Uncharacterized protein n=1 Tax=Rubroshorea leprosula TaxID=152421 RepID=A0AAV5MG97_9ROSI|nr:hypothetical protein SLEP1_g54864 [Rubroshorea leprosula]
MRPILGGRLLLGTQRAPGWVRLGFIAPGFVIIKSFDNGKRDHFYGHCLVVEIKVPTKVLRKDFDRFRMRRRKGC